MTETEHADELAESGLARLSQDPPSVPIRVHRSALAWLAVAITVLALVAGLGMVTALVRAQDKGNEAAKAQAAVAANQRIIDTLQSSVESSNATIRRLERRLDASEGVAACRATLATNTQLAISKAFRLLLTPEVDRDPSTIDNIRALLDAAIAEREQQDVTCDPNVDVG